MSFLKKNSALIAFKVIIVLSFNCLLIFLNASERATFFLSDQLGQRNALNGITIKGALNDPYHALDFTLEDGKAETKHSFIDKGSVPPELDRIYEQQREIRASLEGRLPSDAQTTSQYVDTPAPEFSDNEHKAYLRTTTTLSDRVAFYCHVDYWPVDKFPQSALFKTDFYLKSNKIEYEFRNSYYYGAPNLPIAGDQSFKSEFADQIYAKRVTIKGEHYVAFITNSLCRGQSGIYRVELAEGFSFEIREKMGKAEKLVNIELENGNVQVLGLEAVQDKLVLILIIDHELVVRAYDISGQLLGEIKPDMPVISGDQAVYHPFIKGSRLSLGLFYDRNAMDHAALLSFDVNNGLGLTHQVGSFKIEDGRYMFLLALDTIDGRLAAVTGAYEKEVLPHEYYLKPPRYYLDIFDGNEANKELTYQGELVTDIADDYIIYSRPGNVTDIYYSYSMRNLVITDIEKTNID